MTTQTHQKKATLIDRQREKWQHRPTRKKGCIYKQREKWQQRPTRKKDVLIKRQREKWQLLSLEPHTPCKVRKYTKASSGVIKAAVKGLRFASSRCEIFCSLLEGWLGLWGLRVQLIKRNINSKDPSVTLSAAEFHLNRVLMRDAL